MELSHLDEHGNARMVDVTEKANTLRVATASGIVTMDASTLHLIQVRGLPKGDVLATARIAGIQGAKRTHELIPMCHNLPLDAVEIDFTVDEEHSAIHIEATAKCVWKTGVEMEAMTAVAIAGLTIYDMVKAVDKHVVISEIRLEKKSGGKSGEFIRQRKVL
ncbi:MAG TPA: cyclic pyranopterin monophosphate synthase MoaC [Erysipelotrichaceae bacterium]|nr:cyclic pyranopterin monophosphate synthase MoaC [Erysipelotrichaceae bacterium]